MKLYGHFHITPEPGEGLKPVVSHCSGPVPWSSLVPGSAQREYTITPDTKCKVCSSYQALRQTHRAIN